MPVEPSALPADDVCGNECLWPDSWEAFTVTCVLPRGHQGDHSDRSGGFRWGDPEPAD